ncbi:serine/threonine protein kinase [Insectomime virus]|nr:serine/threonine protein kinase [Insectomime virus]
MSNIFNAFGKGQRTRSPILPESCFSVPFYLNSKVCPVPASITGPIRSEPNGLLAIPKDGTFLGRQGENLINRPLLFARESVVSSSNFVLELFPSFGRTRKNACARECYLTICHEPACSFLTKKGNVFSIHLFVERHDTQKDRKSFAQEIIFAKYEKRIATKKSFLKQKKELKVMDWRGLLLCFLLLANFAESQVVISTTAARSGPAVGVGGLIEGLQTAMYAANNKTTDDRNGVLKTKNLEFLVLDDQQDYFQAVNNLQYLFSLPEDELLAVTCLAPMQTAIVQSFPEQASPPPLFGSFSGDVKLFTPFSRNYLNLRPSFDTEFYVMAQFLTSNLRVSRIAFVAGAGLDGTSLNFTRSIEPFGLRVVAGHVIPDYTVISGPMMDEAVQIITDANPQAIVILLFGPQSAEFIRRCKQVLPDLVFIIETLVMNDTPNELWLTGDSANVYSLSPFPLLADNDSQLQNEFYRDQEAYFPQWTPAAEQAIEGYVNGRWIISILEKMTGPVTRENFLQTVFSNPIIKIGEAFFGPLGDDCEGQFGCCNSATRLMYVFKYPNGFGEYATERPMSWSSCNPTTLDFQVPTKLGQTLDAPETPLRLGIPQSSGFILLSYDDRGDQQLVETNVQELETLDNVPLFISLPLEKALLVEKPVFGVTPFPQEFKENFFSVSLSPKEELWAVLQKVVGSSFLDPFGSFSDFDVALENFGKAKGDEVVVVVGEGTSVFSNYPNSRFVFLSCLYPEIVVHDATLSGISLDRVLFVSSIPFFQVQNISLTQEFEGTSQAEFWSFLNFKFVQKVATGEYSSSRIQANVRSLSSTDLGGFVIGGYSNVCPEGSDLECCNKGSRTVFFTNGNFEDEDSLNVPFCNAKFSASSGDSSSDSTGAIIGGVLGGAAAILLLCCLLVALVLFFVFSKREKKQEWDVDFSELECSKLIGEGYSGRVFEGTWKGQEVAIKVLKSQAPTKKAVEEFRKEAAVLAGLRHPNIILFMAACTKPPNMCIITEHMALGSLFEILHNELLPALPEALAIKIATQAAKGMHFLHSSGIAHRDFKSLNLLVNEKWDVKVSDFGMAGFLKDGQVGIGTVFWTAPEILNEEQNCDLQKADVYSFGIVLWEMLTRKAPYQGKTPAMVAVSVIRDDERPEIPNSPLFDQAYLDLMVNCWEKDPDTRPTFLEVLSRISGLSPLGSSTNRSNLSSTSSMDSERVTKNTGKYPEPDEYVSLALIDIVDAFTFWEEEPEKAREVFTKFNSVCRTSAEKYGAYESFVQGMEKGEGCILFVFSSEKSAMFCCEEIFETLSEESWPGKCRAGIASGCVLAKKGLSPVLYGETTEKLKSLCESSRPGQIQVDRVSSCRDFKRIQDSQRIFEEEGSQVKVSGLLSINTSRFVLNFKDISIGKQIGLGSFGVCFEGSWRGVNVCVKRVVDQNMNEDAKLRFREEASLLAKFDEHKNIVTFVGACYQKPNICLVTVLETPGDLGKVLASDARIDTQTKKKILAGVCSGLDFLHSKNILHRDIKSSNVLVDENWNAKISDFGFARLKESCATQTSCGSPCYTAPEILRGQKYDEKADIFSLGVLIWEVMTRRIPYEGDNPVRVAEKVRDGKRLTIPFDCPKRIRKIIQRCWDETPSERPSAFEVSLVFAEEEQV